MNNEVAITNVKIPFWSMVVLLIKLSLAAIPAAIIMIVVWTVGSSVGTVLVLAIMHMFRG